jgi:hypothetical protein
MSPSRLQQFDLSSPSETTLIIAALKPTHHTGLATVTACLLFHIVVVLTITVVFLSSTLLSFVGEAWYMVAQLQSTNVMSLLENASLMHDGEVERWVEKSGGKGSASKVIILGGDGGGVVEGSEAAHIRKRWEATWI